MWEPAGQSTSAAAPKSSPSATQKQEEAAAAPSSSSEAPKSSASSSSSSSSGSQGVPQSDSSFPGGALGMVYSPYNSDGTCKDAGAVKSDLAKLSNYEVIRIYGTDCNQVPNVLAAIAPTRRSLLVSLTSTTLTTPSRPSPMPSRPTAAGTLSTPSPSVTSSSTTAP